MFGELDVRYELVSFFAGGSNRVNPLGIRTELFNNDEQGKREEREKNGER